MKNISKNHPQITNMANMYEYVLEQRIYSTPYKQQIWWEQKNPTFKFPAVIRFLDYESCLIAVFIKFPKAAVVSILCFVFMDFQIMNPV